MDYQSLHIKTVVELKALARQLGVRVPAGTNKANLIALLLETEAAPASAATDSPSPAKAEAAGEAPAPKRRGRPPKAGSPRASAAKKAVEPSSGSIPAKEQPASAKEQPASAKEQPASAKEQPVPAKEQPVSKEQPVPAKEQPASAKAQPATKEQPASKEPPASAKEQPVSKEQPVPAKEQPASAKEPPASAKEQPASAKAQPQATGAIAAEGVDPAPETGRVSEAPQANATVPRPVQDRRSGLRPLQPMRPGAGRAEAAGGYAAPRSFVSRGANNRPGMEGRPLQRPQDGRFVPRGEGMPTREISSPRRVQESAAGEAAQQRPQEPYESGSARGRREGYYNAEYKTSNPAVPEMLAAGECADGAGVLEIQQDGYGFLRAENCLPGPNDVYISIAQIRRFNLRMGDYVEGKTRPQREGDRYSAMLYITSVNGAPPEEAATRPRFEDLVPIYPDERLKLEPPAPQGRGDLSLRLVDMLAPIGKGQRGMIVSQPKAGKTTLLKKVANAITANYPDIKLIVLLIDERPEEVTDMKRSIEGEVIYSTFDEEPEHHVRVSEMVLERAQRLTEMGRDVVVLMDSITRLARAYNLVITPTGRSLSGGLDPGALFKPKRFFGAARNIENGGSLTVIATALVETGSRMDDIIFEEFKGTGNMELHLDRKLSDKRVFPAIDMVRSGTRREELLLTEAELDGEMLVRRVLSGGRSQEMAEQIIDLMSKTSSNAEFFSRLKGWLGVFEKEGFSLGGK